MYNTTNVISCLLYTSFAQQRGKKARRQRGCHTARGGRKAARQRAHKAALRHRIHYALGQQVPEADERHRGARACKINQRIVPAQRACLLYTSRCV